MQELQGTLNVATKALADMKAERNKYYDECVYRQQHDSWTWEFVVSGIHYGDLTPHWL